MLRISSKNTRPGMVLARPVYDSKGNEVAQSGDTLTEKTVKELSMSDVGQVLITDDRVADVLVAPLFRPEIEAKTVAAMRNLLANLQGSTPLAPALLNDSRNAISGLVQCLFPMALGEADVSGCESVDDYDFVHPARTAALALAIGKAASLDAKSLRDLGMAALFMNLGYAALPPALLRKAGDLDATERATVQQHPQLTLKLLENCNLSTDILQAIEQHHERWDGKGYPGGRSRGAISPMAQIICLADVFHSLVSNRPWREGLQSYEAVEFILASTGELFDPELVQFFGRAIPHYPTGLMIELNTREMGVVIDPNIGHVARPIVRIFRQGRLGSDIYDLDLSEMENMNRLIVRVIQ